MKRGDKVQFGDLKPGDVFERYSQTAKKTFRYMKVKMETRFSVSMAS